MRRSLITAALALVVVTVLGFAIVANPGWSAVELRLVAAVHDAGNPFLDGVALVINVLFGPVGAVLLTAGVGIVVWVRRSFRAVVRFGIVLAVPWGFAESLKLVVQRPRPELAALHDVVLNEPPSFSYPSGHTAFAAAFACAVLLMIVPRRAVAVTGAVVVLITAWSRVELAAHYPTDVLASMVLVPVLALAVRDVVVRAPWLALASPTDQRHDDEVMTARRR